MRVYLLLILSLFLGLSQASFAQKTYTFNGNGKWSDSKNWVNNVLPPQVLPKGSEIIINPLASGACVLDTPQIIASGAKLTVIPQGKFSVSSDLVQIDSTSAIFEDKPLKATGLIPSPEARLKAVPDAEKLNPFGMSLLSVPSKWYIDVPIGGNQNSTNNCTGWAVAWGVLGYLNKRLERNESFDGGDKNFSPDFIWKQLNHGQNQGIFIVDALDFLKSKGDCKYVDMPFNGVSTGQPSLDATKNALNYRIDNYYQFKTMDLVKIKLWLSNDYPIPFSAVLDQGFMFELPTSYLTKNGKYVYVNQSGKQVGTHSMVICGYDDDINAFKVLNSWGSNWRNGGFFWIDYDVFREFVLKTGEAKLPEVFLVIPRRPKAKVITTPITAIADSTAKSGGTITIESGTTVIETGVCYSIYKNPTTASTLITNKTVIADLTAGTFNANISGLLPETKYYLRAFARTNLGIVYGNELSFTTLKDGFFTDPRDEQLYTYKRIGTQVWMTKNLNYAAPGSWCYANNGANCATYGRLYDWNTALTVAPPGWHLPSHAEWITLENYLGGYSVAGGAMKSTSLLWLSPNVGASNNSGWSGLPGGFRFGSGLFNGITGRGLWWSSTATNQWSAWLRFLNFNTSFLNSSVFGKEDGLSVRCIRD